MDGEHDQVWEGSFVCSFDNVSCFSDSASFLSEYFILPHIHLIPDADLVAIPSATGIGKVEHVGVINIEIGFSDNFQVPIIVMFPEIPGIML